MVEPTDDFVIEGLHGDECPFCGSPVNGWGDRSGSGGSCVECPYWYSNPEWGVDYDEDELMTYDELKERVNN